MKKVLVVDDIKGIQTLLSKCLTMEGFEASVCGDGKSALDRLMRERFDLVFLDIRLPFMSGTEVLRKFRQADSSTPVVIITAHANVRNAVDCTRLGAAIYLQKPFTVNRVLSVLDELGLRNSSGENRLVQEAQELFEQRRYDDVEKFLKNMASGDMLNPEIYRLLAEVCRKQNKLNENEKYTRLYEAIRNG